MSYTVDDLKNVLANVAGDSGNIIYTEHYLEKISDRNIVDILVENKLLVIRPSFCRAFEKGNCFELRFPHDMERDLIVVISLLPPYSIILLTALFKKKRMIFDEES